jgi:hypothetical protein
MICYDFIVLTILEGIFNDVIGAYLISIVNAVLFNHICILSQYLCLLDDGSFPTGIWSHQVSPNTLPVSISRTVAIAVLPCSTTSGRYFYYPVILHHYGWSEGSVVKSKSWIQYLFSIKYFGLRLIKFKQKYKPCPSGTQGRLNQTLKAFKSFQTEIIRTQVWKHLKELRGHWKTPGNI